MKFGVREICDVVLRAKQNMTIGSMKFNKDMPVFYFDSLKTSTLESAATTVYAQGGKGNSRLIAWEGEKTITFTMEDALISVLSLSILSGAGVMDKVATEGAAAAYVHATETVQIEKGLKVKLHQLPYTNGGEYGAYLIPLDDNGDISGSPIQVKEVGEANATKGNDGLYEVTLSNPSGVEIIEGAIYLFDYYYGSTSSVTFVDITPDKFAGNYYLEGATLFRNKDGKDLPAEFIIPNCKIQSNFTFTMASSGDPSTFTFTMDAFPDYTKHDKTKKVLAAIQIINDISADAVGENKFTVDMNTISEAPAAASYNRKKNNTIEEI